MSDYLSRRILAQPNIELISNTTIQRMMGNSLLEAVELEHRKTGERRMVETSAVFSMIGATPCTDWLPPEIERDAKGFVKTGASVARCAVVGDGETTAKSMGNEFAGSFRGGRCAIRISETLRSGGGRGEYDNRRSSRSPS